MDTRVRIVIEWINQQPNRDFNLKQLAQQVELSASHLDRLFSQWIGVPFKQHVIRCRLELATRLLRESLLSVKEISHHAGWQDPNYFNRYFKQRFGLTPRQYRREHQGKNATPEANDKILQ